MPINKPVPVPKKTTAADIALVVGILVLVGIGAWMIVRENISASSPANLPDSFTYDISDLKKVDPKLITFEEHETISTNLASVLSLDVYDKEIYVAGEGGLRIFAADGELSLTVLENVKVSSVWVHNPQTIYLAIGNQIVVYDREGNRDKEWPEFGSKTNLRSISGNDTRIFIADSVNRIIYVCSHDGELLKKIGDNSDSGLVVPGPHLDLQWDDQTQLLYVANPGRHRIDAYDENGNLTKFWGKASMKIDGFCGCCNPTAFALMADGGIITAEKGLNRVKRHTRDGELVDVVAAPNIFAKQTKIYDIETDLSGNIFVLDDERKQVRIFKAKL